MAKDKRATGRTDMNEAFIKIRSALFHRVSCWDELNDAERLLGVEFQTWDLDDLAWEVDRPEDVRTLDDERLKTWIRNYRLAPEDHGEDLDKRNEKNINRDE
jgi:hypothetical protein